MGAPMLPEADESDALRRQEGGVVGHYFDPAVCSLMTLDAARKLSTAAGTPQ